eukprot:6131425-Prymnesium_polylepis.1
MRADNASCGVPSVASGSAQTAGPLIEAHVRACSRMWVGGERETVTRDPPVDSRSVDTVTAKRSKRALSLGEKERKFAAPSSSSSPNATHSALVRRPFTRCSPQAGGCTAAVAPLATGSALPLLTGRTPPPRPRPPPPPRPRPPPRQPASDGPLPAAAPAVPSCARA